jgi:acetyl-CoA acyltransferase
VKPVLIIDGARLPFRRAGSDYLDLTSYDLVRSVLAGLLQRSGLDSDAVDQVIMGCVVQNPQTSNVARDGALAAGFSTATPAHTVTMACISANRAIADSALALGAGHGSIAVAGGVELLSDPPMGFNKKVRKRLFAARKARTPLQYLQHARGLKLRDLKPETPAIAEFSSGETMGASADRLAALFGVTREEQDAFALRSHQLAAFATRQGLLAQEVLPTALPPDFASLTEDNSIRVDSTLEQLARLPAAFVKPFGTVTAGNSSPLTDGAAAVLLATQEAAQAQGLPAKAVIRDWNFVAQDPGDELLLGPAFAVPQLLARHGLSWNDLDVIEIHEAFAGQVLAVLAALGSERFGRERLGLPGAFASIDLERINLWGGSLSLGHPFGATGARLVTTAVNRLHAENGRLALVTACAAGGQGHAMLIERVES